MKFKFVKKGTEISSEQVSQLMNFEQVADKAAGMGSAPLAKGALASKSALMGKVMWVVALPFTAAVYLGISSLTGDPVEMIPDEGVTVQNIPASDEITAVDSVSLEETTQTTQNAALSQPQTDEAREDTEEEKDPANASPVANEEPDNILIKEDIMIRAEPINGFPAFYDTIDRELAYPEEARISGVEGFVRVYFVVDKDGTAGNFRVVRSLGDDFDEEALRVMKKLTEWKPAMHNGQAVSSHLSIKLRFELEKE